MVKVRFVKAGTIPFVAGAGTPVTWDIWFQVGAAIVPGVPDNELELYHNCKVALLSAVVSQVETPFKLIGNPLVFSTTKVM
jgi:hypothetical protein